MQRTMAAMFKFDHGVQTLPCTWHTSNKHLQSRCEGLCGLNKKINKKRHLQGTIHSVSITPQIGFLSPTLAIIISQ